MWTLWDTGSLGALLCGLKLASFQRNKTKYLHQSLISRQCFQPWRKEVAICFQELWLNKDQKKKNTCSKDFQLVLWNRPSRGEKLTAKIGGGRVFCSDYILWHEQKNPSTATQCKHFDVQHSGSRCNSKKGGLECPRLCVCLLQALWPNTNAP